MSKRKFFSGNSIRQAVVAAASHFDVPPDEVAYREVDKKHGFLKLRKRVIIEVDADDPRRPPVEIPAIEREPGDPARLGESAPRGKPRGAGDGELDAEPVRHPSGPAPHGDDDDEHRQPPELVHQDPETAGGRGRMEPPLHAGRGRGGRGRAQGGGGGRQGGGRPAKDAPHGRSGGSEERRTGSGGGRGAGGGRGSGGGRAQGGGRGPGGGRQQAGGGGQGGGRGQDGRGRAGEDREPRGGGPSEGGRGDEARSQDRSRGGQAEPQVRAADQRGGGREPGRDSGGGRGRSRGRGRGRGGRQEERGERREEGGRSEDLVELPERSRPAAERYQEARGELADACRQGLDRILDVAGIDVDYQVFEGDDRFEIELSGSDEALILAEGGDLLRAIEHLVPRAMRGVAGESTLVRVNCGDFHEIHEERLRSQAQQVAAEVRRNQRPSRMEPMSPADRRIVHLTLADEPGVTTASDGNGHYKQVVVKPA